MGIEEILLVIKSENLKEWIGAYYCSAVRMRQLDWAGDYAFAAFPGCRHPEGHD